MRGYIVNREGDVVYFGFLMSSCEFFRIIFEV